VAVGALLLAFILLMVLTLVGGRLQQQHYVPGQRA
jgi:hypothetical protein